MSRTPSKFWDNLPLGPGVELLTYDANGLAALAKPAGVLSHPNMHSEQARALLNAPYVLKDEFYEWTPDMPGVLPQRVYLLNRLDSATSGVILVAASVELAKSVREMFLHKHVRKIYNALVFGQPSQPSQLWRDRLSVQKKGGQVRAKTGGNIPAEAQMTVLRQRRQAVPPLALIKLDPRTGRSHQLRVQCGLRHLPIVGDLTYGDFAANRQFAKETGQKRLFLHSLETRFDYEWAGRTHSFAATAPLPKEFQEFL